ncbi:MAG: hypothetical protein D6683_05135 [Actinomyces sp.]|nr:MAG: hypothetical protein D6683_05135 [Actinomyces sp.]
MRILTLASVRGSPGVTTAAVLLGAAIEGAVVVEGDLDGGVLAVRYGLGREPGLITFAAAAAETGEDWRPHAQEAGGVAVMVGPDAPAASAALWRTAGERITRRLLAADGVAVVDAGRVRMPRPIVTASDVLGLVVRPVAEQLVALTHLLPVLRPTVRGVLGIVLAGDGPYRAADIERTMEVPIIGSLPEDRPVAEALCHGGAPAGRLRRSRLARGALALARAVHGDRTLEELGS